MGHLLGEEEYVSCQSVITLFVPVMDTLCGRSFQPVCYDRNMYREYFEVRLG